MSLFQRLVTTILASVSLLLISNAFWTTHQAEAQSARLDHTLTPQFKTITLDDGFPSHRVIIDQVGNVNITGQLSGTGCIGFAAAAPHLRINWQGKGSFRLAFQADRTGDDALLIVHDAHGRWHCNDDAIALNPSLTLSNAPAGSYEVWVGSYNPAPFLSDQYLPGSLTITADKSTTTPSSKPSSRLSTRLSVGDMAYLTTSWRNLRTGAGTHNPVRVRVQQYATMELLEGPVYDVGGMPWWRVYVRDTNREGWISEGSLGHGYALATVASYSVCSGQGSSRLAANETVYVLSTETAANRIRNDWSTDGSIVGTIEPGEMVHIITGPRCSGGYVWWLVNHDGTLGWTAEGDQTRYFIGPVTER